MALSAEQRFVAFGAGSGFLAVALGAMGAHALKDSLEPHGLELWEIAAKYQMYHALALLAVGWQCSRVSSKCATSAGWLFVAGTVLFSGSLYALALTWPRAQILGAVTPFGGISFMAGWICLGLAALKKTSRQD